MPTVCCVPLCTQRGYKKVLADGSATKISFHKFPSDENLKKEWLIKIRRDVGKNFNLNSRTRICSTHFKEEDYRVNVHSSLKCLKKNSVPSVFAWTKHIDAVKAKRDVRYAYLSSLRSNSSGVDEENGTRSEPLGRNPGITDPMLVEDFSQSRRFEEEIDRLKKELSQKDETIKDLSLELQAERLKVKPSEKTIEDLKKEIFDKDMVIFEQKQRIKSLKIETLNLKKLLTSKKTTINKLDEEIRNMKNKLDQCCVTFQSLEGKDEAVAFFTGIPSYEKLVALYEFLEPGENGENVKFWYAKMKTKEGGVFNDSAGKETTSKGRKRKLPPKDQFLLTMMKLRLGLFQKDLAHRFCISQATVSKICISWINYMYFQLGQQNIWATREYINSNMPSAFKEHYPSTRIIIDATEIKCETPQSFVLQSGTYSNYKSTNTYKGLLGITPNGYVSFVSSLHTGCISDKEITVRSGFTNLEFEEGDTVMCDKGFKIQDLLDKIKKNIKINIPPFLANQEQFSLEEIEDTQKIASVRIHVERRIQRVRTFRIFDRPIPITLSPIANQIWTVCVLLTNYQSTILKPNDITSGDRSLLDEIELTF